MASPGIAQSTRPTKSTIGMRNAWRDSIAVAYGLMTTQPHLGYFVILSNTEGVFLMSELFAFLSQVGVYPVLVLLWFKMDAVQRKHESMLQYLEEICPHCDKVKALLPK